MRTLLFHESIYNLDKFIGIEIINNLETTPGHYNVLFRFQGDYQTENTTTEETPFSFCMGIGKNTMYNVVDDDDISSAVSEFVNLFNQSLINEKYKFIDICDIRRQAYEEVRNKKK